MSLADTDITNARGGESEEIDRVSMWRYAGAPVTIVATAG